MKKQYKRPEIKTITIRQEVSILAGSPSGTISNDTTDKAYGRGFFMDFSDDEVFESGEE